MCNHTFLEAGRVGCFKCVKKFIENRYDIIGVEERNTKRNILHYLCMGGHHIILSYVIEQIKKYKITPTIFDKSDVGFNEDSKTPLIYSILRKSKECMNLILENIDVKKSNVIFKICSDISLFEFAINTLMKYDIDINKVCEVTPLILATYSQNLTIVKKLLDLGANPNKKDKYGWAPLHYACGLVYDFSYKDEEKKGNIEIVKVLLEYGADKKLKTDNYFYPHELTTNLEIKKLVDHRSTF